MKASEHRTRTEQTHPEHRLRQILELTHDQWDRPNQRDAVRTNFRKVCACRTPALGGEVYASAAEEKIFYHTCKSRYCPSCGNRGTRLWQREQWLTLPEVPFVGIVLTMPDLLWPIFRKHRRLQHDLPSLGAVVIQQWAWIPGTGCACACWSFNTLLEAVLTIIHTFTLWFQPEG
jgi:hypothetical protein